MIDAIANKIRSIFELHCSALDESTDWWADAESGTVGHREAASHEDHLVVPDLR